MPLNHKTPWEKRIQKKFEADDGFLPYWDFKIDENNPYYTISPDNIPEDWLDISTPRQIFDVPEIWYGIQRNLYPQLDYRPWHEVDFCRKIWDIYSEKPVELVFEVCCGISPHGSLLAKEGCQIVGMDASEGMIKALETRARTQNLSLKAYRRDVFQFSIPGNSPDAAILLGNTFPLAKENKTDNTALVSQLRSVGTFLKRGTIYIIDCGMPHPHPPVEEYTMAAPTSINLDNTRVTVTHRTFPTNMETFSTPYVQGYAVKFPAGTIRLEYRGVESFVSPQHLSALVEMSKIFDLVAFHHWGSAEPGLHSKGGPYLAVLKRK
ncbi:MAG: class I SAM-dependent methyltransferase [Vulcanimicrobiota bacterium]